MKKTLLIFIFFIGFSEIVNSQVVNIPDAKFKAYLIGNRNVNTNGDNEIQFSEANAFSGSIDCFNKSISDLTGIESFINIIYLNCGSNQLTKLDVSNNIALKGLYCEENKLTSLDVSKNKNLSILYCYRNNLISLNTKNGRPNNLGILNANDNPNLGCIQVDNVEYANFMTYPGGILWQKPQNAYYSLDCSGLLSVTNTAKKVTTLYPIPAKDILNFSNELTNIRIIDFSGKILNQNTNTVKAINISKLAKGLYIINAETKYGDVISQKFIKE